MPPLLNLSARLSEVLQALTFEVFMETAHKGTAETCTAMLNDQNGLV